MRVGLSWKMRIAEDLLEERGDDQGDRERNHHGMENQK